MADLAADRAAGAGAHGDGPARVRARAFEQICALLNPFSGDRNRSDSIDPDTDWGAVYEFAAFHGVRPALHKALSILAPSEPALAELQDRLSIFQRDHRFRVMQTTAQIVRLAKAFEAAQIEALFFKGATLGEQIYGGAQYREFNDVDILVGPSQRRLAEDLLVSLEFVPIVDDARFRSAFFDYMRQHIFRHFESSTAVDFHWGFVGAGPFPISTERALENCVSLKLAGVAIPVPGVEAQALILAGHGHKENWASFGWILDFATFAAVNPALRWDEVAEAARSCNCLAPVLAGVMLVERLFAFTIDKDLAASAASRAELVSRVDAIVAKLEALTERQLADDLMGGFRQCETPFQKAGMALSLLTTPTIGDFEAMPLGRRWWWLYRLTRPMRLAIRTLVRRAPGKSEFWTQKTGVRP